MTTETTYQWLEPKPYKKSTKQLGIKGRNMIVWNLVHPIVVQGHSPEEVAADFRLPLEAVHEALAYYCDNEKWINEEVAPGFVMPFDIAKSELDRILKNLERDIQDEIRTKTRGKRQTDRT